MRQKTFARRIEQADNIARSAYGLFEQAADELELASRLQRETYDDIQERIDALTGLAADSRRAGERAERNAKKLRSFFS